MSAVKIIGFKANLFSAGQQLSQTCLLPIKLEDRYAPLVTREIKERAEPAGITTLWGSFIRERWKEAVVLLVVLSPEKWISFAQYDAILLSIMSSHSQDFHINCVDRLCRVCGFRVEKRYNKGLKPKPCKSYVTSILQTFNIDIMGDGEGTQSCLISIKCYYKLINAAKRAKDLSLYISCE